MYVKKKMLETMNTASMSLNLFKQLHKLYYVHFMETF